MKKKCTECGESKTAKGYTPATATICRKCTKKMERILAREAIRAANAEKLAANKKRLEDAQANRICGCEGCKNRLGKGRRKYCSAACQEIQMRETRRLKNKTAMRRIRQEVAYVPKVAVKKCFACGKELDGDNVRGRHAKCHHDFVKQMEREA